MKECSPHFLGKVGSLGPSENWPVTFWGNRGLSRPLDVGAQHLKSSFALDFPAHIHLQLQLAAVAERILCTATPASPLLPCLPYLLAGAEQPVAARPLFCILLQLQPCAETDSEEFVLGTQKRCHAPHCLWALWATRAAEPLVCT